MHFEVRMQENGRKNIFKDKPTKNKAPLMFLDVEVLTGGNNCLFELCQETSNA